MSELQFLLLSWCLLWAFGIAFWFVLRLFKRSITWTPRSEPTGQPKKPEPTTDDNVAEVIRAYHANCARILSSPMDDTARQALLQEEQRILGERLGRLME